MKPVVNVTVGGQNKPTNYTYKTVILKSNLPFAPQVTEPNCIYVIKWNYDLKGQSVTIPKNCVLKFEGGSLSNGTIIGQNTIIEGTGAGELSEVDLRGTFSGKCVIDYFCKDNTITQDVIDKALVVSDEVLLNNKSYLVSNIEIENCKVCGVSKATLEADTTDNGLIKVGSNVSFENIKFVANEYVGTIIEGVQNSANFSLANCEFILTRYNTVAEYNCINLPNFSNISISKCTFKDGWNDHNYDAHLYGGANVYRTINITNHEHSNVSITDCRADNVWSFIYVSNTNNVIISRNIVENIADTAIFERCTAGYTSNKEISFNILKNIGKSAIKTLDTNNTVAKGISSVIVGNIIEDWGMCLGSGAILAASNYDGAYLFTDDETKRNRNLTIANNLIRKTSEQSSSGVFQLYNLDNLVIVGNTIEVDRQDDFYVCSWSNAAIENNIIRTVGSIRFYELYGTTIIQNNKFECSKLNLECRINEQRSTIMFSNNIINITSEDKEVNAFAIPTTDEDNCYIIKGNIIKSKFDYDDSYESSAVNVCTQLNINSIFEDNIVIGSSDVKHNKISFGTLENPTHYQALKGSCTLEDNGNIRYLTDYTQVGGGGGIKPVVRRLTPTITLKPTNPIVGQCVFDEASGKPIWYKGNNVWVNATGETVPDEQI